MYYLDKGYLGDDTCSGVCSCDWKEPKEDDSRVSCTWNCTGTWTVARGMELCACI